MGTDTTAQQEALLQYLQEVFKLDDEKHNALLEQVKAKEVSGHPLLLHKKRASFRKLLHILSALRKELHILSALRKEFCILPAGGHSFRNTP